MTPNTETILIVFVALTGIAVLLQACVLLGILVSLRKTAKSLTEVTGDIKSTIIPLVFSTRELVERITPEVVSISKGLSELTETVRKEANGVTASAGEIVDRINNQSKRLDAMLTSSLNAIERAGDVVESAVAAPVRQVSGVLAAIRAIVDTLRSESSRRKATQDPDYPYGV
jgi:methyl-accepting chemotaxis protein